MPRIEVLPSGPATSGATWAYTTAPPPLAHTTTLLPSVGGADSGSGGLKGRGKAGGRTTRHSLAGPGAHGPNYNEDGDGDGGMGGSGGGLGGGSGVAGGAGTGTGKASRKDDKLQKHLLEFEKDNARDVVIPVPKPVGNARATRTAHRPAGGTATTRKILASQKTLTNHLSDEEAFLLQQQQQHGQTSLSTIHPAHLSAGLRATRRDPPVPITENPSPLGGWGLPLSHAAARADPSAKPPRAFCEICGYWGTYKCLRCGARYCTLDCKETHEETRCQRFWV